MKIQQISLTTYQNNINFGSKPSFKRLEGKISYDKFEGSKPKENRTIFDKIHSLFVRKQEEELTPEKKKGKKITKFVETLTKENEELGHLGSYYNMALGNYIVCGKLTNFKDYTKSFRSTERLLFEFDNSNPDEPSRIIVVDSKNNSKIKEIFDIKEGEDGEFTVTDYSCEGYETKFSMKKKRVKFCKETNLKTGITKELTPTKNGFRFFEAAKDPSGETNEKITEVITDSESIDIYKEKNSRGELKTYTREAGSNIWEKQ